MDLGGVGVLDLEKFARALGLRWLWQEWADPDKPWVGLGTPCNRTDRLLFAPSTTLQIGDGAKISFWNSAWASGCRPRDLAPDVFALSRHKNRCLNEALTDHRWIRDLNFQGIVTAGQLQQIINIWGFAQNVQLDENTPDKITWKWTANGVYSASSAYRAQFLGSVKSKLKPLIWKPWAPQKCKFFAWLISKNRVWTADRLATRGWPRNEVCPLCRREPETAHHLLATCRYTMRVWTFIATWVAWPQLRPSEWQPTDSAADWWCMMATLDGVPKKALRSLLLLVNWEVWKERNARTFVRNSRRWLCSKKSKRRRMLGVWRELSI